MKIRVQNHVTGRLSLRPPQADSLAALMQALAAAPEMLGKQRDVAAILSTLKAQFPTLEDFEREFPSLCFALATGVGKTRLMGAFVAYLHLAHGINNFFVLAPNLTIYDKLIADFTPNTPKYVFKGIGEFAINPPRVITGDNYDQSGLDITSDIFTEVRINIFNISKINAEVRGGKEPRIKRMREVLGDSYFNHLAGLPDLVLLMDESHRYRAQAGLRAINELNPLFGLELTATPFVESPKGPIPFLNVVVDYPLARAMADGFVKEPAVATQRNFKAADHSPQDLERIKLEDSVRLHESTKAELLTYARENGVKPVKPFVLVIARDTTHAGLLKDFLESDAFHGGRYRGKVIQVDSSRTGSEEEKMIQALLNVESADEPTEIVVHVNMLKEGWDVTNLYTIVPLRAANARTLIEQSIGRGLRLPYGKRTGVEAVDRLSIVAHDRFQEIIDEANRGDSPIRLKQLILEAPSDDPQTISVQVQPNALTQLGLDGGSTVPSSLADIDGGDQVAQAAGTPTVLATGAEISVARVVREVIAIYEAKPDVVPTSTALLQELVREQICEEVRQRLDPAQGQLLQGVDDQAPQVDLSKVVETVTRTMVGQTIDIPRITLVPKGEVTNGFRPFKLSELPNYQPGQREILIQELRTSAQSTLQGESGVRERRPEDYIVKALMDYDDVDYFSQADLLYDLAGQAVAYYRAQGHSEDALHQILGTHGGELGRLVHAQMAEHFWEDASGGHEARISHGFTGLKPCNYTAAAGQPVRNLRETLSDMGGIRRMLFGGFRRCLYPLQKFDSDTERRFAVLLERDAMKWFRPARRQFQIYYRLGNAQPEYVPDFVAETADRILMVETKARGDLGDPEVLAKAEVAARWCGQASRYTAQVGGKPWSYLLIPHDEIDESRRLIDFMRFEKPA